MIPDFVPADADGDRMMNNCFWIDKGDFGSGPMLEVLNGDLHDLSDASNDRYHKDGFVEDIFGEVHLFRCAVVLQEACFAANGHA